MQTLYMQIQWAVSLKCMCCLRIELLTVKNIDWELETLQILKINLI